MDIDAFHALVEELATGIPPAYLRELNGGILVLPEAKRHPRAPQVYVLGEYRVQKPGMGRYIAIYYGSFRRLLRDAPHHRLRRQVWETLLHEIRHHLESLAGVRDLEREDEEQLRELLEKHAGPGP